MNSEFFVALKNDADKIGYFPLRSNSYRVFYHFGNWH